jgi:hypothetical protein
MKSYNSSSQFDLIPDYPYQLIDMALGKVSPRTKTKKLAVIQQLLKSVFTYFTHPSEPRIWKKCDRNGNFYFHIYDPVTGQFINLGSEQEVRCWLERRYYQ